MPLQFLRYLHLVVALALFADMAVAGPEDPDRLSRDFADFVTLWGGSYDNREQLGRPASTQGVRANAPLRLHIQRVDLPDFGEHVFYAEWQALDDPDRVMRQRLYGLRIDRVEQVLRLELHVWPTDRPDFIERTRGAYLDPARLADVTPQDMVDLGDCDLRFRRARSGFEGAMQRGTCAFDAPDGTPIYSWTQMRIAPGRLEYLDGWFHLDGSVYQRFSDTWYQFTNSTLP